jgi:hypothetical protein
MKKYLVEFTYVNGKKEVVELFTDRIEWSIEQFGRNKPVINSEILEETTTPTTTKLLFG